MTVLDRIMVAVALAAALWLSRRHRPAALEALSFAALALALATLLVEGQHWQLVPWQVLALAIVTAAALRLPAGGTRAAGGEWSVERCLCSASRSAGSHC